MDVVTFVNKMDKMKWDHTFQQDLWERPDHFKIVIVGEGAVGKTCLVWSYVAKKFPEEYIPTVMDLSIGSIPGVDGSLSLSIWDTAGREDYEKLRPLSYPGTKVVLICFSVISEDSFGSVTRVFLPEIKKHLPDVPIILVGTKSDLRTDTELIETMKERKKQMVPKEKGKELAKQLHLHRYMECSALTQVGLKELYAEAVKAAASYQKEKEKGNGKNNGKCILL